MLMLPQECSVNNNVDRMITLLVTECRTAREQLTIVNAENAELRKQIEVLKPIERILQRNERSQQRLTEMGRQLIAEQQKPQEVRRAIQRNLDETSCAVSLSIIKEFDKQAQQPWLLEHVLSAIEEMRTVIHKVSLNRE
jgi:hypothetical protein